ncbi:MAG: LptA/OstA family protein [Parvularculaceae bacterium]
MTLPKRLISAIIGGALLLPAGAVAQLDPNSTSDVAIASEHFAAVEGEDFVTWTGHVQVQQDESILTTDKLVATGINDGEADTYRATGNLRFSDGAIAVSGQRGVFDLLKGVVTVEGNVLVVQGEQVMSGDKLVYNMTTGKMVFSSNGTSRVRGVFRTGKPKGQKS